MLYADDAGVVSTSPRGLTRMMGVIVVTCQEFGLTVSEKKTEAMHLWSHPVYIQYKYSYITHIPTTWCVLNIEKCTSVPQQMRFIRSKTSSSYIFITIVMAGGL